MESHGNPPCLAQSEDGRFVLLHGAGGDAGDVFRVQAELGKIPFRDEAQLLRLDAAAAVGIVEKIISFVFLVPSSMLSTVSALCAQNIGAGKQARAEQTLRYAIIIAVSFGIIIALLTQFISEQAVGLFTPDVIVITLGGQYLRGYIWDALFAGIHFCFSGYFCACGRSEISFIHNISAIALVRIPGVYLTSKLFPDTLFPIGLATAAGALLSVIICVIAFALLKKHSVKTA